MKTQKTLTFLLLAVLSLFSISCKEDEATLILERTFDPFSFGEFNFTETPIIDLDSANFYYGNDGVYGATHIFRSYYISDGTLIKGMDGSLLENYNDATYCITISLAVLNGEEISTGNYLPHFISNNFGPDGSNAFIYFNAKSFQAYINDNIDNSATPIKISGGVDTGETIEVLFEGILSRSLDVDGSTTTESVAGKFSFKGKVGERVN